MQSNIGQKISLSNSLNISPLTAVRISSSSVCTLNSSRYLIPRRILKFDVGSMAAFLSRIPRQFSLFDCELVENFSRASNTQSASLRQIYNNTLLATQPIQAVTLVQNHDTRPGQSLAIPIQDFFNPLAYALILFRREGYPSRVLRTFIWNIWWP